MASSKARAHHSPRDRQVAGGMAWCIRVANESVDIDLLFQEGLRMGEKVHISENIERALAKMKCPHLLQSQELYHMNCLKIFPVVQWLVKKVIEVRAETADALRLFSESQFQKQYSFPGDLDAVGHSFVAATRDRYNPARKYRLRHSTGTQSRSSHGLRSLQSGRTEHVDSHVHSILVEYGSGHLYTMALMQQSKESTKQSDDAIAKRKSVAASLAAGMAAMEEAAAAEREAAIAAQQREAQMLQKMQQLSDQNDGQMADLVNQRLKRMQATEDAKASADAYKAVQEENAAIQTEAAMRLQGQHNHKRYLAQIEKLTLIESSKLAGLEPKLLEAKSLFDTIQTDFNSASDQNSHYESEIQRMLSLENDENRDDIAMLRALVSLNESLKLQISMFKASCKDSMSEWRRLIDAERQASDQPLDERLETISQTYQKDLNKLRTIQSHLSSKTRAIALVRRKMDEIPSRRELQQYQKHFLELYEQMALRFTETRQYYNTFNSLQDRRDLLQRELNVLNQIQENYPLAMKNKASKSKFAENLSAIADQVAKSYDKASEKLKEEKEKRDSLDDQHSKSVEKERAYYAAAKAFQLECATQEQLLDSATQLESLEAN